MTQCPECLAENRDDARHCAACGQALPEAQAGGGGSGTVDVDGPASRAAPSAGNTGVTRTRDQLFDTGEVLLDRYRIESLLGVGGMGSVYLAEDRLLKQKVALKFMNDAFSRAPGALDLLLNEVRVARRVSHPNVCRVHDVGEVDGRSFISMEYVDGENLTSLLNRIGRMAGTKAHQIARQLCAGLFAAHEQGVLHRDLKPANVMVDGKGNVRITDFGIAAAVETITEHEPITGTPGYMAPELFQGNSASVASDIYALGLVLYELYTGEQAVHADSIAEFVQKHGEDPVPPAEHAPHLESRVERIILDCLASDPRQRPASAMAVLRALPGGDPLAESLAAGRTPSPELIASAGATGSVPVRKVAALILAILLGLTGVILLDQDVKLVLRAYLPDSPEILTNRARDILRQAGFDTTDVRSAAGFEEVAGYMNAIEQTRPTLGDWEECLACRRGGPLEFWYRQVPMTDRLEPRDMRGRVRFDDPTATSPGAVRVRLDPAGNLRALQSIPVPQAAGDTVTGDVDWDMMFGAAGLELDAFHSANPSKVPLHFADERVAWTGTSPDVPQQALRIEAAAYAGRPVMFDVFENGVDGADQPNVAAGSWRLLLHVALIVAAAILALRSVRSRRSDNRGAVRLALVVFAMVMAFTLLSGDHGGDWGGVGALVMKGMTHGIAVAILLAVYYLAVETTARRVLPQTLIGWERALSGRAGDPLVGHDLLMGLVLGVLMTLLMSLGRLVPGWFGDVAPEPLFHPITGIVLKGTLPALGAMVELCVDFARESFKVFVTLVLARILVKDIRLAALLTIITWTIVWIEPIESAQTIVGVVGPWVGTAVFVATFTLTLIKHGLLTMVIGFITFATLLAFPLTLDLGNWMSSSSLLAIGVLGVTMLYGVITARR